MDALRRDLAGALRFARRQPLFTGVAVLTLALGIGANATIFSVVNAIFYRPLPVREPSTLVSMFTDDTTYRGRLLPTSYPNFVDYRASGIFEGLSAEVRVQLNVGDGTGPPERVAGGSVSANYFDVLGVPPLLGRTFRPDEDAPIDSHPVIVLSSHLWRTRFASDRGVVGRTLTVNGLPYTVVGVAADGFRGATLLSTTDAWVPIGQRRGIVGFLDRWFVARQAAMCAVYGRIRSGDGIDRVRAAVATVSARLAADYPQQNHARSAVTIPFSRAALNPNQRGQVVRMGWFLTAAVGLVLALACTNVANLLLLRALGRRREIAVRIATGASRGRIVRQLMTESLLLAGAGGAAGVLVATTATRVLWSFKPPSVPDTLQVPLDVRVWAVVLGVTAVTGLLFGLAPALQASRSDVVSGLKNSGSSGSGGRSSLKNTLVVVQVALSLVLLVGTGLVLRSLGHAERLDPGIAADHLITLNIDPAGVGYDKGKAVQFFRRVVDGTQALPGVRSAAFAFNRPLTPAISALFYLEGRNTPSPSSGEPIATNAADLNYFQTVGIPIEEGRAFTAADTETSAPVIIINQALRDRFFGRNESPIGTRMRFVDTPTAFEIVGVAGDAAYASLGETAPNYLYYPFQQVYGAGEVTLYVRTEAPAAALAETVRREVQSLDPNLPVYNTRVVADLVTQSLWAARAAAVLLAFFGGLGLVLATIGTYGVMSYHVDQARRETGIRLALGATPSTILRGVIGRGARLVATGVLVGMAIALSTTPLVASLLYDVPAMDPLTFLVTPCVLAGAALAAIVLPARRATLVDPLQVLRTD